MVAAAAVALLVAGCALRGSAAQPAPGKQAEMDFKQTRTQTLEARYLLFLPKGYAADAEKKWPLILFLHGAGERGADVWKVATHGPPKVVGTNANFPFIVVSPQCPSGQLWSRDVLLALLDKTIASYRVDTNRIYLTGLSMGGYGTWDLGLAHAEKFAAIVPICGGGEFISAMLGSRDKAEAFKSLGVWAFHGGKDPTVPLQESERMVELVKRVGLKDAKLTVYPEAGHDSWTKAYSNPELYDWLLQHERKR